MLTRMWLYAVALAFLILPDFLTASGSVGLDRWKLFRRSARRPGLGYSGIEFDAMKFEYIGGP
jgi:hypothetical protein